MKSKLATTALSGWLSTELQEDATLRKVPDVPTSPDKLVEDFFDWQLETSDLDFVVVSDPDENLISKIVRPQKFNWPKVILEPDKETLSQASLVRLAMKGFQLLVATNSSSNELNSFFEDRGYRQVGCSFFSSGEEHDPLRASWSRESLARSVAVATRMGANFMCCFAHDADPIYLLSK